MHGQGVPDQDPDLSLAKQRVCKGKGNKRRCRLSVPQSGNLDLTHRVAHKRVKVGSSLVVAMIEPGSIGKEYVFQMVREQAAVGEDPGAGARWHGPVPGLLTRGPRRDLRRPGPPT